MVFGVVLIFISFLFKGISLSNVLSNGMILIIAFALIFLVFGLALKLEMTNEGFLFCGQLKINKISWREIQRVEYKVDKYRRRGPNVEIWVYGTNLQKPIKVTFFMFEKEVIGKFFDVLKARSPQAVIDPQVMEYVHGIQKEIKP
jgi:hypothetical protein